MSRRFPVLLKPIGVGFSVTCNPNGLTYTRTALSLCPPERGRGGAWRGLCWLQTQPPLGEGGRLHPTALAGTEMPEQVFFRLQRSNSVMKRSEVISKSSKLSNLKA